MLSKQQYKWLKWINQKVEKRPNLNCDETRREQAKKHYLLAKKSPHLLQETDKKKIKGIIKARKIAWQNTIYLKKTALNENEMKMLISKNAKYPQWKLIDIQRFINGLKIDQYILQIDNTYQVDVEGDIAMEEFITERWSKIWLPFLAIVISIGALVVAVLAL